MTRLTETANLSGQDFSLLGESIANHCKGDSFRPIEEQLGFQS